MSVFILVYARPYDEDCCEQPILGVFHSLDDARIAGRQSPIYHRYDIQEFVIGIRSLPIIWNVI